jgi:chromosome segregation ATPase
MTVRAHAEAIAAHKQLVANQAATRQRLTDELAATEAEYHKWLDPKTRYERAKNDTRQFHAESAARIAEAERKVRETADPRILAAIQSLDRELEQISLSFSAHARRAPGQPSRAEALDAKTKAIQEARAALEVLILHDVVDVEAAIQKIESRIPAVT